MPMQKNTKLDITIISRENTGAPTHRRTIAGVTKIEIRNGALVLHHGDGPVDAGDGGWFQIEGRRSGDS